MFTQEFVDLVVMYNATIESIQTDIDVIDKEREALMPVLEWLRINNEVNHEIADKALTLVKKRLALTRVRESAKRRMFNGLYEADPRQCYNYYHFNADNDTTDEDTELINDLLG